MDAVGLDHRCPDPAARAWRTAQRPQRELSAWTLASGPCSVRTRARPDAVISPQPVLWPAQQGRRRDPTLDQ